MELIKLAREGNFDKVKELLESSADVHTNDDQANYAKKMI